MYCFLVTPSARFSSIVRYHCFFIGAILFEMHIIKHWTYKRYKGDILSLLKACGKWDWQRKSKFTSPMLYTLRDVQGWALAQCDGGWWCLGRTSVRALVPSSREGNWPHMSCRPLGTPCLHQWVGVFSPKLVLIISPTILNFPGTLNYIYHLHS